MLKDKSDTTYQDIYKEVNEFKKNWLSRRFFRILRKLRLMNSSRGYRAHRPMYHAHFWGDRPIEGQRGLIIGSDPSESSEKDELERSFVVSRGYIEPTENHSISNVTYTSRGYAWVGWALDGSSSSVDMKSPLRFFKEIPFRTSRRINEGTIVQSFTPFTYGDWVPEHRNSIISAEKFPVPLVLPSWIGNRSYVQQELSDLGVEYIVIDRSIFIENAYVLGKKHPFNLMLEEDVQAYKAAYNVPDVKPKYGEIVYLSRGLFSRSVEMAGRNYPSDVIGKIVEELGGRVIDTNGKNREYYREIADQADIVIADHGGAIFNIMEWKPRVIIEIVEDGWWNACFVFLSAACGATYHGIIRSSYRSESDLRNQIMAHIENGAKKHDRLTIQKMSPEEALSFVT